MYNNEGSFNNYLKSQISYIGYVNNDEDDSNMDESYICILVNTYLNHYKTIWIVEGMQDVVFYGNVKMIDTPMFVFASATEESKQLVGKQNVLSSYMLIKENMKLSKCMNRYVFMVDHDYDGIEYYQPRKNSRYEHFLDKKNISVTEGYSFENYITTKENIEKIFEIVCNIKGLDKNRELEIFNEKYDKFKEEIVEFFSWFACIVYAIKNNYIRTKGLIKIDDIFNYDFSSEEIYNKNLLKDALEQRKNVIFNDEAYLRKGMTEIKRIRDELKREQKNYYEKIKREDYIQGHTLYNFLVKYFYYYFNYDLRMQEKNEKIKDILEKLNINFPINLGNGKKVEGAI